MQKNKRKRSQEEEKDEEVSPPPETKETKKTKRQKKGQEQIARRTRSKYPGDWTHKILSDDAKMILEQPHQFGLVPAEDVELKDVHLALCSSIVGHNDPNSHTDINNDVSSPPIAITINVVEPKQPSPTADASVAPAIPTTTTPETKADTPPAVVAVAADEHDYQITKTAEETVVQHARPEKKRRFHISAPNCEGVYPCCGAAAVLSSLGGCREIDV